eukprot:2801683-Pyramimonas_sp.AAC.1
MIIIRFVRAAAAPADAAAAPTRRPLAPPFGPFLRPRARRAAGRPGPPPRRHQQGRCVGGG